ncbi:DUF2752 domain-containing protein [Gordonia zhaorongruii]|uniref:DUF2752 domain-containing protein n=1 Tax=Gordonia zhaorongruii TaxID=2597659 RepID=UPI00104F849E|nr:DUF2752 domain-containing protein [Gordonia zhaorongruii]
MTGAARATDRSLPAALQAVARHRIGGPAAILAGVSAIGAAVWFADPTTPGGIIPPCPLNSLLHVNCPGCGVSRAIYHLLHGDVVAALHHNALFVIVLGLSAVGFVTYSVGLWRGRRHRRWYEVRSVPISLVVITLAWFVIRNIPVEPFTGLKV